VQSAIVQTVIDTLMACNYSNKFYLIMYTTSERAVVSCQVAALVVVKNSTDF